MVMRWLATRVAVDQDSDLDTFCVALAEEADGGGRCLMFQAGLADVADPDFDEVYCLVTETQACVYGGVRQLRLTDTELRLVLSRKAAAELGWSSRRLKVALAVESDQIGVLNDGLARVLAASIEGSRPWRLALLGPRASVRARSLWRWPPWGGGACGRRVTYRVAGIRGALADLVAETDGFTGEAGPVSVADDLANQLGVSAQDLVGRRLSYLVTPDRWGTTYSRLRPEKSDRPA